jgi:YbgC/YbaW family acyl-CoA thioester hydrolase
MYRFERDRLKDLRKSCFQRELSIRFQDVDAAGIIFYPNALALCHDIYVEFLAVSGAPLHEALQGPWIAPVRHAEADYLRPLRFGDRITISIAAAHLEPIEQPTEVTLGYRVTKGEELSIVAQTVHTFVDPGTFKRVLVPDVLLRAFAPVLI